MEFQYKNKKINATLENRHFRQLEKQGFSFTRVREHVQESPIDFSLAVVGQVLPDEDPDAILDAFELPDLVRVASELVAEKFSSPLPESQKVKTR